MVIFRENTEDIYAGIEFAEGIGGRQEGPRVPEGEFPERTRRSASPRRAASASSRSRAKGSERLVRAAHRVRGRHKRKSVTLVHKGNIMKFTEGAFRNWGYALAEREFARPGLHVGAVGAHARGEGRGGGQRRSRRPRSRRARSWSRTPSPTSRSSRCSRVPRSSTSSRRLNLNGDYLSDALAAQVGGIGIAPGGNINYVTGHAIFEATHGTAPKYANLDKVNPGLGRSSPAR